jgi:acyl-CoA thioesterase-1
MSLIRFERSVPRGTGTKGATRYGRRRLLVNVTLAGAAASVAAAATNRRLLVLGDSLTAGYGLPAQFAFTTRLQAALTKAGATIDVVNAGVSGDTSAGGLARIDWAIGDPPPQFAIVALGANDGLRGLPPDAMERNLDAILVRLHARKIKTLLAGMYAPRNLGREYEEQFNGTFARVAARNGAALYPFFLDGVAAVPALNQQDGIHPNAAGVEVMVERILPHVLKLVAE